MKEIMLATEKDRGEILALYKSLVGSPFCAWTENYPGEQEIDFDLSRKALLVMKEEGRIIAAISIDDDEEVKKLECWSSKLQPAAEISRVAVALDRQGEGIAREMFGAVMKLIKERGNRSAHYLVNKLNVKALRSYEHLNFVTCGECELFGQEFFCCEKEL